jgi:hypothetical protein
MKGRLNYKKATFYAKLKVFISFDSEQNGTQFLYNYV